MWKLGSRRIGRFGFALTTQGGLGTVVLLATQLFVRTTDEAVGRIDLLFNAMDNCKECQNEAPPMRTRY